METPYLDPVYVVKDQQEEYLAGPFVEYAEAKEALDDFENAFIEEEHFDAWCASLEHTISDCPRGPAWCYYGVD